MFLVSSLGVLHILIKFISLLVVGVFTEMLPRPLRTTGYHGIPIPAQTLYNIDDQYGHWAMHLIGYNWFIVLKQNQS